MKNSTKVIAITALSAVLVLTLGAPAFAGGSDSPTPYTVDETGITLPKDVYFEDNGHVNTNGSAGGKGIHFESLNNQPSGVWIGKSFLPWSAVGLKCGDVVTWVQLSQYNEHYGEGGQPPVTVSCGTPTPTPTPTETSTPTPTPTPTDTPTSTPVPSNPPEEPGLPVTGLSDWVPFLTVVAVFAILLGGYFRFIRPQNLGRHVAK